MKYNFCTPSEQEGINYILAVLREYRILNTRTTVSVLLNRASMTDNFGYEKLNFSTVVRAFYRLQNVGVIVVRSNGDIILDKDRLRLVKDLIHIGPFENVKVY
jgi:hypothetical protein